MAAVWTRVRRASRFTSDRWLIAWAVGYAAIGAASLLIPLYALSLGGGPFIVGSLEATAGLAGVPGALIWGRLADQSGHRRGFVLLSLAGSGAVLAVFPFVRTLPSLLVINTVLWFLVAAAVPVVTLFMIEDAPEREWERRIGMLNAYQRYGWVGGLVVGTVWLGAVSESVSPVFAQRSFFGMCAGGLLLATPLAFYWLPPEATTRPGRLTRSRDSMYRLVAGSGRYLRLIPYAHSRALISLRKRPVREFIGRFSPSLRRYFLTAFLFSTGAAMFFGPAPAYLSHLEYSAAFIFGFFILASLASAMLFVPVGTLTIAHHPKSLQLSALGVRTVLFPAFGGLVLLSGALVRGLGMGLGFVLLGVTWAVIAVTSAGLVSRSARPTLRGEALGFFTAVSGIGGGIGGLLGGYLAMALGYLPAFAMAGVIVLLSLLVLLATELSYQTAAETPESA